MLWTCRVHCDWHTMSDWMHRGGEPKLPWRCKNQNNTHFPQQNYLLKLLWLICYFLWIHFDGITIFSLLNALFIRCFKLICTARVIDCKHRPQWCHQQIHRLYHTVVVYEKKNRSLVFSGSRKIPSLGSTIQWETRQALFPTGTVGPRVRIFLSPLNTNDGFYLSHIPVPARGKDKKQTAARWSMTSL